MLCTPSPRPHLSRGFEALSMSDVRVAPLLVAHVAIWAYLAPVAIVLVSIPHFIISSPQLVACVCLLRRRWPAQHSSVGGCNTMNARATAAVLVQLLSLSGVPGV